MTDYITKPLDPNLLFGVLARSLTAKATLEATEAVSGRDSHASHALRTTRITNLPSSHCHR